MRIHKNAQPEQGVNTYEIKSRICSELDCMKGKNAAEIALLKDAINIRDYEFLVRNDEDGKCIWTDAFQKPHRPDLSVQVLLRRPRLPGMSVQ